MIRELEERVVEIIQEIDGWCSKEKAIHLAQFALEPDIKTSLELGVYCGKSLIPTAMGFAYKGEGVAWGVDCWSLEPCIKGNPKDITVWENVNFQNIFEGFLSSFQNADIFEFCNWIRASSQSALPFFKNTSIDLLHLDSNHSEENNTWEIENYFPLVRSGGIVVLDDVDWDSVKQCVNFVENICGKPFVKYSEWAAYRKP